MKEIKETFETITVLFEEFEKDAIKAIEKGNKSAARRARLTSLKLRDSLKKFKAISINI